MNDEKASRILAIDYLRILAIFGVILVHTTTKTMETTNFTLSKTPVTVGLDLLARFCVPLFFIISGFVLEYRYKQGLSVKNFYKRRLERILMPYLVFSTAYFLFHVPTSPQASFSLYIQSLLLGTAEYHLYFIPTIILFYLIFPFLHRFKSLFVKPKILSLLFLIQVGTASLDYYSGEFPFYLPFRIFTLTFFFFISGMAASHHVEYVKMILKKWRVAFLIVFLTSYVLMGYETFVLFSKDRNIHYLYSQWRPSVYFYTLGLGAALFPLRFGNKYEKMVHFLSRTSFFVFFIHIFILYTVWSILRNGFPFIPKFFITAGIFDLCLFLLVTGISYAIAYCALFIPKLSFFVGIEQGKRSLSKE